MPARPVARFLLLSISVCSALLLAGCEPQDRRPGTWLSGEPVREPVNDWSFVNDQMEVFIETRPWFGIPFSITTVIAEADGRVYVPSIYETPAEFPGSKYWNGVIADNPAIQLKVGGRLYPLNALPAADDTEFAHGLSALAAKYDFWRNVEAGETDIAFTIIRLHPRADLLPRADAAE